MKAMFYGLAGTYCAGKGEVAKYLCENYGFTHYSVRDFLNEIAEKKGLNRDNLYDLGNTLRAQNGSNYLVKKLFERALDEGRKRVIIDSIRNPGEVKFIKKCSGILVSVDADLEIRYKRSQKRASSTDQVTFKEFVEKEREEMWSDDPNKQSLGRVLEMANYKIKNNKDTKDLYRKLDNMLIYHKVISVKNLV